MQCDFELPLYQTPALTLYLAVPFGDIENIATAGCVPCTRGYIGLRESPAEALDRVRLATGVPADKDTHALLQIVFTCVGVAHFATTCAGLEQRYSPLLTKRTYRDDTDWKVWHFLGDLPLRLEHESGELMVFSSWRSVV